MKEPILLVDRRGDMRIFPTREQAQAYLEPHDVRIQEYIAYDSEGRRLQLRVERKKQTLFTVLPIPPEEQVVVQSGEGEPTHREELREQLIRALSNAGEPPDQLATASLTRLVSKALAWSRTV
jgi:hypothetical protein